MNGPNVTAMLQKEELLAREWHARLPCTRAGYGSKAIGARKPPDKTASLRFGSFSGDDEDSFGFHMVARIPTPVSVVIESCDERHAVLRDAYHGVVLPTAVEFEDPDLVAQDQRRGGDLLGIRDAARALVFGHRLVEGVLILLDVPVVGGAIDDSSLQ